jgi:hypothetical protein
MHSGACDDRLHVTSCQRTHAHKPPPHTATHPRMCFSHGGMAVAKSEKDLSGSPLRSVTQLVP